MTGVRTRRLWIVFFFRFLFFSFCLRAAQILERQKKHKPGELEQTTVDLVSANEEAALLELGVTAPRQRRNV
jgi:hypothetical protein